MQPENSIAAPQLDILADVIGLVDRASKAEIPTQRVILLGAGAMYGWVEGRRQFRKMKLALEQCLPDQLGEGYLVETHWLGYPKMDAPYAADDTLSSIALSAHGVQQAVTYFPNATIDFVCHSLCGVVVLYWSLKFASAAELSRINSITTINSPLKSYEQFYQAAKLHLQNEQTLFGTPYVPTVAQELRAISEVSGLVANWNLPIHLQAVYTVGDPIVPPEIATLDGRCRVFKYEDDIKVRATDRQRRAMAALAIHRQALIAPEVQKRIIDTICTPHLATQMVR
jgi:hypothetical protein